MTSDFDKAAHLWRRAGFGTTTCELYETVDRGIPQTVDMLLDWDREEPELESSLETFSRAALDLNNNIEDVRAWWLFRILNTKRPLREKLTLFWHGHFATSAAKVDGGGVMLQQNQTLRRLAGSTFSTILDAISKDPAMLIWLDGNSNRKGKPNENFARELFELFALGIGNYTEHDVREAARAFTGCATREAAFRFDANQHDTGVKKLFGVEGKFKGSDVTSIAAAHPAAAGFIAYKLCRFFVNDNPDPAFVERVAATYRRSNGHIAEMVRAIFTDPDFFHPANMRSIVKSPLEFTVGAARVLGAPVPIRTCAASMKKMGQVLLAPPSVKGWDGGVAWLTSTALFERSNYAVSLTSVRGLPGELRFDPKTWAAGRRFGSIPEIADALIFDILHQEATPASRAAIIQYLNPDPSPPSDRPMQGAAAGDGGSSMAARNHATTKTPAGEPDLQALDPRIRGAARLLLSSPEFQLA